MNEPAHASTFTDRDDKAGSTRVQEGGHPGRRTWRGRFRVEANRGVKK